jgi:hypothetical protein
VKKVARKRLLKVTIGYRKKVREIAEQTGLGMMFLYGKFLN